MEIGEAGPRLMSMLPGDNLMRHVEGNQFVLDQRWLDRRRNDGTDHRSHFEPLETDPRNVPLKVSDLELIPAIYREPDRVEPGGTKDTFVCVMADGNGNDYCLVVDAKAKLRVKTFYKRLADTRTNP